MMTGTPNRMLQALCWLWVVAVATYLGWGAFSYSGLYAWLADWQIAQWGAYYREWTAVLPGLLLAAPALAYLGRASRLEQAAESDDVAAQARRTARVARNMAIAGIVCLLVAGGAYRMSQDVPDGSEPPTPLDLAVLADGQVPVDKVAIIGEVDADVVTGVTETSRSVDRNTLYVGFHPDGEAPDAPVRLFVERYVGDGDDAATSQGFMPEQTGYLVKNGLPPIALRDLEQRGIEIGSPHYLLKPREESRREPYYVVTALGAFVGAVCLLMAPIALVQARRRARQAT